MSKAYECDLCGNLFKHDSEREDDYDLRKWTIDLGKYMAMDICPECYAALLRVIKERKEKVR